MSEEHVPDTSGGRFQRANGLRCLLGDQRPAPLQPLVRARRSVRAAGNLDIDIDDFRCRWIVIDDIWIPLGATLIISRFRPVWNIELAGFGNHDPSGGRYNGLRPLWDTLHAGSTWAAKCQPRPETPGELERRVRGFLSGIDMPEDPHIDFDPGSGA